MKQKNLTTIVTYHQLTADTIAKALGANEKHEGYYLGNGYAVTWTNGSVIEATFKPDERFVLSTSMDPRLVYAHNFKFAMRDCDELLGYKKTEQDIRQTRHDLGSMEDEPHDSQRNGTGHRRRT